MIGVDSSWDHFRNGVPFFRKFPCQCRNEVRLKYIAQSLETLQVLDVHFKGRTAAFEEVF